MGAYNGPSNAEVVIPDKAQGNPVYEQTRQDMPMWCCGRNCGRNARITVFILGLVGIACSSIVCLSPHYFSFVSTRNDTFYCIEKNFPKPFEFATEANVGLFRYEILEVFEYPWPPEEEPKCEAIPNRELQRLTAAAAGKTSNSKDEQVSASSTSFKAAIIDRLLQNKFPDTFYGEDDDDSISVNEDVIGDDDLSNPSQNVTTHQNDTVGILLTKAPSYTPPSIEDIPIDQVPDVLPGSNEISRLPTTTPTMSPTGSNPNDKIDVDIGVVRPYPAGVDFDSLFSDGQMGAMWAPILATIGLFFSLIEFCCCTYKCSWLPTALFLYAAFMLQLMTMFLFMSEDFCKYDQDCVLGYAGLLSAVAVIAYLVCQMLVCMTPRPPPIFNLCKKPPVRRKKKKKKKHNEYDETPENDDDRFIDDPNNDYGFVDPYNDDYDHDPHDARNGEYDNNDGYGNDGYNDGYDDNDGYGNAGYDDGDQEPYGNEDQAYGDYDEDEDYDDYEETPGTGRRRMK